MNKIIDFSTNLGDRDRIKEMARSYFNRNPRLVKSFVRDLAFLLSVIKPRYDYLLLDQNPSPLIEQEKKNLQEILQSPGLLAKVIVIREKFPSEFIKIQEDPTIISKLEDNPGFDSPGFETDVKTFISFSWPLFKQREANPANFILLGGSSGTEFRDEIDVGQFISYANSGDAENFCAAIFKSPLYKRAEYLTTVINAYNSAPDDSTKINIAKSVIVALHLVEDTNDRNSLLNSVIGWVEKDSGALFTQMTTEQIQKWIKGVEGSNKEDDQLNKMITLTPYGNSDESLRDRFWEAFTIPSLTERVFARLAVFISSLLNDSSFPNKQLILDNLSKSDFTVRISKITESLNIGNSISTYAISIPYSDEKIKAVNLNEQIYPDENNKKLMIEHLISWINSSDDNQKNFAKERLLKTSLWPIDRNKLVSAVESFRKFYKTLDKDGQNNYHSLVEFLKGKEVWYGKLKHKRNSK